jgi:oligo-1,6-glucosidase
VRAAALLLLTLPGMVFVYQGDEIGMKNGPGREPPDDRAGRDPYRHPMAWDDGEPNKGFTSGTPWLAVNPNHTEINVEAARADPDSVLHHYRRLIELRHTEPAVALGDFAMHMAGDERVYAFTRRLGDVELFVLGNFSSAEVAAPEAEAWAESELLVRNGEPPEEHGILRPWETRVYKRTV